VRGKKHVAVQLEWQFHDESGDTQEHSASAGTISCWNFAADASQDVTDRHEVRSDAGSSGQRNCRNCPCSRSSRRVILWYRRWWHSERTGPMSADQDDVAGDQVRPKLLDAVRSACRARHFSGRTAEAYAGWVRGTCCTMQSGTRANSTAKPLAHF
jgi:hypothetical protein